jgi:hypothetical protein
MPACSSYASRIIYPADRGAGIRDRIIVMQTLARLAVSVCALLAMDPPCQTLKRGHNRGRNVSCEWGWDRYVRISHDGADVLNSTLPPRPRALGGLDVVATHAQARKCGLTPRCAFVWTFPYFHTAPVSRIPIAAKVDVSLARHLSKAADTVLREVAVASFSTLHIRRRDTTGECDTSIPRVVEYVNCSTRRLAAPTALLLYTDERSRDYLQPLLRRLRQVSPRNGCVACGHSSPGGGRGADHHQAPAAAAPGPFTTRYLRCAHRSNRCCALVHSCRLFTVCPPE